MTTKQLTAIRIALAEMDGWTKYYPNLPTNPVHYQKEFEDRIRIVDDPKLLPNYTTSIDATRSLVMKKGEEWQDTFGNELLAIAITKNCCIFQLTALDWCEAALRVVGKWEAIEAIKE